ncbi:aflatoxin regulatory protein-domain-containing protein [Chaetomium tenue]|uniref:Aflatoxin regulatory protein-domain-containing protein n=1 Tax=Chaetomium tenue TaxID=1854479 RepID=A0ACB7PJQ3_9PEZI|nr:aflatoxin regulatory protein-domain-containing protein [Chaetomium globosum]
MLDSAVRHSVGQGSTQGPRKLRDSCTDCASSKVRCSKEKPTCARCARRGVACIYMVSRRTGRTSSNASKIDATQIWIGTSRLGIGNPGSARVPAGRDHPGSTGFPGGTHGSSATRDRLTGRRHSLHTGFPLDSHLQTGQVTATPGNCSGPDIDMWNYISPTTLGADPAGSPPMTGPGNDVSELFDLGLGPHMIMDREESSSPETNDRSIVSTPDIFGDLPLSVLDADFSATHTYSLDWNPPTGTSTDSNGSPVPLDCCLTTTLDLLARLFANAAHGCTLSTSNTLSNSSHNNARTIESVITDNKHAIETLTNLLDCHCSHDEYLLSLMTLATLKVMGWYAAAAAAAGPSTNEDDGNSPTPPTPSPSTSPPPSEHVLSAAAAALAPTSLGTYCLAGAPRLVLGELHRVGQLAQALAQRLEGVRLRVGGLSLSAGEGGLGSGNGGGDGSGSGGSGGGLGREPPLSVSTLFQLEEDLRRRMRVLAREVVGGLGGV